MAPRVLSITKKFLRDPKKIEIIAKQRTLETTNQTYYEVAPGKKQEALARVLDMETPGSTIVFCRTRIETAELSEALSFHGYSAEPIHGDMGQSDRERVLRRFREGLTDLLIATDVAARGLDIDHVTHVINYDVPFDAEQYIHRIGRTGRAGRTGDAITLIYHKERRKLENIEREIGSKILPARIPTVADIAYRRKEAFVESLRETLSAGEFESMLPSVTDLAEDLMPWKLPLPLFICCGRSVIRVNTRKMSRKALLTVSNPRPAWCESLSAWAGKTVCDPVTSLVPFRTNLALTVDRSA